MSQIIAANAFKVVEGRPVTSSRIVAEYFGKQHHHVVRDIRTLISQKPDLERNANFGECSETINLANGATRQVPFFWMDRKGFSLLAMGFTGAKALDFKCAFYDQFERMEEALRAPSDQSALITTTEQYEIRKAIKAPTLAEGSIILSAQEAEALLTFIYYARFLFLNVFSKIYGILRIMDSPFAGKFWDAFNEVPWWRILDILAKHGHDINDMQCYQHWLAQQPKRKAA